VGWGSRWFASVDVADPCAGSERSIIEVHGAAGASPQVVEVGQHSVLFDGVLFNAGEVARDIGGPAGPPSEEELVAYGYLKEGVEFFARLRGAFAVVLCERRSRHVLCVHDQMGVFPLFYALAGGRILISPFQDVLLEDANVPSTPNRLVLAEWVTSSTAETAETFFAEICRLPPGHALVIEGRPEIRRYWHVAQAAPEFPSTDNEAHAAFDALLSNAVARSLNGRPAGVLLSGGADSATVAGVAAALCRASGFPPLLALSAVFPGDASEESAQLDLAEGLQLRQIVLPVEVDGDRTLVSVLDDAGAKAFPSLTPWERVYDELGRRALDSGCATILNGLGGNELLDVRPEVAADFLLRADVTGLLALYRRGTTYFASPAWPLVSDILLRSGLRLLVRQPLDRVVTRLSPGVFRSWRRRRYAASIPGALLPDLKLRAQVVERMVERHSRPPLGEMERHARLEVLESPSITFVLESNFVWSQHVGVRALSPLSDVDLVEFLYQAPPKLRLFRGRAKGLAQASLARRLGRDPSRSLGAPSVDSFFRELLLREGAAAFDHLHGVRILSELGIVDEAGLRTSLESGWQTGVIDYSSAWVTLALEAWLRPRL
jgi:hypothetical protein